MKKLNEVEFKNLKDDENYNLVIERYYTNKIELFFGLGKDVLKKIKDIEQFEDFEEEDWEEFKENLTNWNDGNNYFIFEV